MKGGKVKEIQPQKPLDNAQFILSRGFILGEYGGHPLTVTRIALYLSIIWPRDVQGVNDSPENQSLVSSAPFDGPGERFQLRCGRSRTPSGGGEQGASKFQTPN